MLRFGRKLINWNDFVCSNRAISQPLPHLEGTHMHKWPIWMSTYQIPYHKAHTQTHTRFYCFKTLQAVIDIKISPKLRKHAHIVGLGCFVNIQTRLADGKWCHLTENHCIVALRLLGNCNWTGIAMQHNSCLHNCTIKILKCHYFGHIHLNKGSSASQHVFYQLG